MKPELVVIQAGVYLCRWEGNSPPNSITFRQENSWTTSNLLAILFNVDYPSTRGQTLRYDFMSCRLCKMYSSFYIYENDAAIFKRLDT